jgi:periplasmic divalent cation tolerance protein
VGAERQIWAYIGVESRILGSRILESRIWLPGEISMAESLCSARIVLTTTANADEGAMLAGTLVEERLAACASLIPSVQSIYHWEGQIESSTEALLLLKTTAELLPALEARLHELHSYQIPEFLVLDVDSGGHPYLNWLQASVRKPLIPPNVVS